jgi:ligand-binding SRPBCC domain-containing protein
MPHFHQSILIDAPAQAVFDFHADPRNIERVAVPPACVQLLLPYDGPLRLGSIVRVRAVLLGMLPQTMETEIVVCRPPYEFVEVQRRGPFRAWRHRHLFREVEAGTELTDEVEYELPTALPFRLLGAEAMTSMMANLFAKRQELTKALVESTISDQQSEVRSERPPDVFGADG